MIPGIELIAAHAAGDFIFQTQWMAANKLKDARARAVHVAAYTACFLPSLLASGLGGQSILLAMALIAIPHFILDSRRWASPDPWPPRPILVDQSLHLIHLALLSRMLELL